MSRKNFIISFTFSYHVIRMKILRKIGPKGQIVIPKIVRDCIGIKPGDTVVIEVREGKIIITPGTGLREFVESFCSVVKENVAEKIDLKRLIESETEKRLALQKRC